MKVNALVLFAALAASRSAFAWDVHCEIAPGVKCPDPLSRVRQVYGPHPRAEHRRLFAEALDLSGLPPGMANETFDLPVFTNGQVLVANVTLDGVHLALPHTSVRPVRLLAQRRETRTVSLPGMSNLPDFAYTLWDWATGDELCPPDPSNADPVDCHNYETHIGWLNSNHMVPQARRFYEHLHRIAIERARACKSMTNGVPPGERDRMEPYLLGCEREALVVEAVAHHYLQDAWASGHMWERWGGSEINDFGNNRALGFAVAALTGLIHGAKAALDDAAGFSALAPWDDPMNAPHPDVFFRDAATGLQHIGIGDIFLPELFHEEFAVRGRLSPFDHNPQRRALLGCAVDGVREVYFETAQLHGPLGAPDGSAFDGTRRVADDTCWGQRATNRAMGTGCAVHRGAYPAQFKLAIDLNNVESLILLMVETEVAPRVPGAPVLNPADAETFRADAAYACTEAIAMGMDPATTGGTELASGGMPSLLGIQPNSAYLRGGVGVPPATWADPFLPWTLDHPDPQQQVRTEALHLTFADAHAADRCTRLVEADLNAYRDAVGALVANNPTPELLDARCGQCVQMIAPHFRFGRPGNHDPRRDAFCAYIDPASAFVFSGEDPNLFSGSEPTDHASRLDGVKAWCGCSPILVDVVLPSGVRASIPSTLTVSVTRDAGATRPPLPAAFVELIVAGGTLAANQGVTDLDGFFQTTVMADPTSPAIVIDVIVREQPGGPVVGTQRVSALVDVLLVSGTWTGDLGIFPAELSLSLTGSSLSGSYTSQTLSFDFGPVGTVEGTVLPDGTLAIALHQTLRGSDPCPGEFSGSALISNHLITGLAPGVDCSEPRPGRLSYRFGWSPLPTGVASVGGFYAVFQPDVIEIMVYQRGTLLLFRILNNILAGPFAATLTGNTFIDDRSGVGKSINGTIGGGTLSATMVDPRVGTISFSAAKQP